jgi:hypothetical protein
MTCRIARAFQCHPRTDMAMCCACGSANLEMCATSRILGPHLCETCIQSRIDRGVKMGMTVPQEGASITNSSGFSRDRALQTAT